MSRAVIHPAVLPVSVLLLSMVACTAMPPVDAPPMANGPCVADAASWSIGRAATPEVVERARAESHSTDVRVIEPGQPVTMDFNPDRLNINVNERGAITGLKCG
ncbi:I78 family peptidase inhibitor [Lysobacter sp. F6437]|uniref:I78 family peptidase inhibitor n=1 Tax=Lysobacter sp. F6437 TaxID=3459296 RepID=UPI00403DFCD1